MPVKTKPSGPLTAKVVIVGEAPGADEEVQGVPFVGQSGVELTRMLNEAGILRSDCFLTNVCKYRPPGNDIETFFLDSKGLQPNELIKEGVEELKRDLALIKPTVIIALGNTALWALTGHRGITKWRGSMLEYNGSCLIPTYHPAMILREWAYRAVAVHDFRRAATAAVRGRWPDKVEFFIVRPTFSQAKTTLEYLLNEASKGPLKLASDLETRGGYIACHGIAWSNVHAICLPFMCVERVTGYWTLDEELHLWDLQKRLLTHPNVSVVGQNYLYDAQYFARRWGYVPRCNSDTMFAQNVVFPGLPKGLDYLSSMYRQYHIYWKDEGKHWDPKLPEEQLWIYNCRDAVATFEIDTNLNSIIDQGNLRHIYEFQMRLWHGLLEMMLRGVNIDKRIRGDFAGKLLEMITERQQEINFILGHDFNVRSPKQMSELFYGQLKLPIVKHRQTHKPTCNEEALEKFVAREPLLKPLIQRIVELRSAGVFLGNFIQAPLDPDDCIRTSYSLAETYRLTSSESAFGTGTNLQNIPHDENLKKGVARDDFKLPNVRLMFIPKQGYTIAEIDLTGADAQVVAWEAGDEKLKAAFRAGLKIHRVNSKDVYGDLAGPNGDAEPFYTRVKKGVHLTNYGGSAKTCASAMNVSEHEAIRFQTRWFQIHPEIRQWHERTLEQLMTTRCVSNKFGYRRFYYDRVDGLLPEALAWVPQSTVACVTNRALVAIHESKEMRELGVELLMQVHDSLVFQYPTYNEWKILPRLKPLITFTIPYSDPLVIPWGLKTSLKSWGACAERPDIDKATWQMVALIPN